MALFTELVPIITFFIAYQLTGQDLYIATSATIIVGIIQIGISLLQKKDIPIERWVNIIMPILLGGIALISKNSNIIKWKPTVAYGIIAANFSLTSYRSQITLLEQNLGSILSLSRRSWSLLNKAWIAFFCVMGLLNLLIAYTTDTQTWVYFKLFGCIGLTLLFITLQILYLSLFKKIQLKHEINSR